MSNTFNNSLGDLSNLLQILNFIILMSDFNNADLMKYLAHQDKLLEKIIKQNEEIIDLLKQDSNE